MPNKNNIWYRFFNQSSLQNEEWLDPSDAILKNIESEIYPKKKRRWYMFLFPLGLLLLIVPIVIYSLDLNFKEEIVSEKIEQKIETEVKASNSTINNEASKVNSEDVSFEVIGVTDKISLEVEPVEPSNQISAVSPTETISKVNATKESSDKTYLKSQNNVLSENQINSNSSLNTGDPADSRSVISSREQSIFIQPKKPESNVFIEQYEVKENSIPNENIEIYQLSQTSLMPLPFEFMLPELALEIIDEPKIESETFEKKPISIITGSAFSFWNFTLNNNYQTALQPADFTHQEGKGFMFFTELQKQLSPRVSSSLVVSFEKVNFNSGHNSTIQFDNSMMSDDVELTMATPLGFISSIVTIDNLAAPSNSVSDIILDLNNEHSISNLDFGLQFNYKLIAKRQFNVDAIIGPGISYLSSNKNNLASFAIDKTNYGAGQTMITKDQDQIASLRLHSRLGFNVSRQTSDYSNIGLQAMYKADLKAIYNDGADFNTTLSRFTIGAYYKWQF